jgi:hypothetical protein
MRLGLFLTTLAGLASASHSSSAADARGLPFPHWRMAPRRTAPAVSLPGRRKGSGRVTGRSPYRGTRSLLRAERRNVHSLSI